jgi:hypothetical protein
LNWVSRSGLARCRADPIVASVRRACLALILLVVPCGVAAPAAAQSGFPQAFVVADVPADATARDAVAAREAARAQGEAAAFQQLLQRLTQPADWGRLPHLEPGEITQLLVDFQVANEHASAVRYIANFTFRFNPKAVRDLLQRNDIPFSELASKPVVIVPVLIEGAAAHLWDDPNPWRDAWKTVPGRSGIVPWIVPVGDLADIAALDQPDATHPQPSQLAALAQHYDDGDVVTAIATLTTGLPGARLDIAVTRYGSEGDGTAATVSVDGPQADASLYLAGVQAATQLLETGWKQKTAPAESTGDERSLTVAVAIGGPADWAAIRRRLAVVPVVHKVAVELMTRREVRMVLTVAADPATLGVALAQQDLTLADGQPYGRLSLTQHGPAPAATAPQTAEPDHM